MISQSQIQGVGVSARSQHFATILDERPNIPWFELMVDNCFAAGGLEPAMLDEIAQAYPVVLHGVQLSLGSYDGIDLEYVRRVKKLKQRFNAAWYSEHCSFSGFKAARSPDLFPMPYTEEALDLMSLHIMQVQNEMQEPLLLENISYYHHHEPFKEAAFFSELVLRTDCRILLDVNNLYVNSVNFGYSIDEFLNCLPLDRIDQIHVAGHSVEYHDGVRKLIDTHSGPACSEVLALLALTLSRYQAHCSDPLPAINIEWDSNVPVWSVLEAEVARIQGAISSAPVAVVQELSYSISE